MKEEDPGPRTSSTPSRLGGSTEKREGLERTGGKRKEGKERRLGTGSPQICSREKE